MLTERGSNRILLNVNSNSVIKSGSPSPRHNDFLPSLSPISGHCPANFRNQDTLVRRPTLKTGRGFGAKKKKAV